MPRRPRAARRPPLVVSVAQGTAQCRRHRGVMWVDPDFYAGATGIPDDSLFPLQRGPAKVSGPAAWDLSIGGSWPIIAIVDTGIDATHPDLAAKILPGWNFVANSPDTSDDHGHGTHVSGITAALSNNADGLAGMAWGNPILPVKVLDSSGRGTYHATANDIIHAADHDAPASLTPARRAGMRAR
jgi:thermitase